MGPVKGSKFLKEEWPLGLIVAEGETPQHEVGGDQEVALSQ